MTRKEKNTGSTRKRTLIVLCALLCAIAVAVILNLDPYDNRILDNVRIGGVQVGGMTRSQAREALAGTADALSREDMVIRLPEEEIHLSPVDTGITLNVKEAVDAAYDLGRAGTQEENQAAFEASRTVGHEISLLPYLERNEAVIRDTIQAYANRHDAAYSAYSYTMEGTMPELAEDAFDPTAPGQTLVLTMGTPGVKLDVEDVYSQVLDAYDTNSFLVEIEEIAPEAVPQMPDLAAIYQEVYVSPADASLDMQTYEFIPGTYGYRFDLEEALKLVGKADYGETIRIPMETIEPEMLGEEVYFRDVLGEYNSGHSGRVNIATNLQLVCDFLDGVVVQPGEVFSYNDTVGERTVERGFMYGESFTGNQVSRSPGGGVCQGSSVLYVCTLLADLEIVERVNHGIQVGYTPPGQDAAVSWGEADFRFRNSTHFPIKITAELGYQTMRIQLLGTDEKDYYIELESTSGHDRNLTYANCYKRKYDKQTGELLSREIASRSAYLYSGD